MKVAFDSNIWRIIATPDTFPNEPSILDFVRLQQVIIDKRIEPFLSETIFTIESIRKKDRKSVVGASNTKVVVDETPTGDDTIKISIKIGPGKGLTFDDNPILKKHFDDALALGFKIVRIPRIAGLFNTEVEKVRLLQTNDELEKYHRKVFEVVEKIEAAGAGMAHISQIGKKFHQSWIDGIKNAPDSEEGKIAKAAAEWADGDSIAMSIAMECDYFCTRDKAKSAGEHSVLSSTNLAWLNSDYALKIITPEKLAQLI
ncbi:MAG TPA: hypothetical protein VJ044_10015 [Candidatus Hodarchaeales archaeon]|nr:hypothetical protein [Candidatus Hodarchaeales archaeon]